MTYQWNPVTKQIEYSRKKPNSKIYYVGKCCVCNKRFLSDVKLNYCSNKCQQLDESFSENPRINSHILQYLNNPNERVYYVYAKDESEARQQFMDTQTLFWDNPHTFKITKIEREPQPLYKFKIHWEKD